VALSAWLSGVNVIVQYLDSSDRGGICGRICLALSRWLDRGLWLLFDGRSTATTIAAALLLLPAKITCLSGRTRTSSFVSPGAVRTDDGMSGLGSLFATLLLELTLRFCLRSVLT